MTLQREDFSSYLRREIATRVKAARAKRGWTLRAAGENLGISHQTIYLIENKKAIPTLQVIYSMAMGFGIGVEDILPPMP